MATRKSPTSAEKKTTTRKAPARKTVQAAAAPAAENSIENIISRRTPSYEEIARLAEQLWNERGRPDGSPEVDWLRAEQTLYAA
ncbi:MAG TPA: DUF2934 domain-containing protein [Acidobacteriaceae bacterium]|jgi:hypothetical protein